MMNSRTLVKSLSSSELLSATHELVQQSRGVEAELLVHLAEIDDRKLYLDGAFPSMFAFCVGELGFSEDAAYTRINVARAARRFPLILGAVRSGDVHLTGLRLLAPHLTAENHRTILAEAAGKSKRHIEELVARLVPQPPVPTVVRRLPTRNGAPEAQALSLPAEACAPPAEPSPSFALAPSPVPARRRDERRSEVAPLSEDAFKFQFTGSRACHDKYRRAQDLLRHTIPDGDLATIVEKALDLLIEHTEKKRFAQHRKPKRVPNGGTGETASRHIPDAVKRTVFERDGGRCTFVDERGRRCAETGGLEFDHLDGFARTRCHQADRIRLLCRAHNQHAAEQMYGRGFMERARAAFDALPTVPGIHSG